MRSVLTNPPIKLKQPKNIDFGNRSKTTYLRHRKRRDKGVENEEEGRKDRMPKKKWISLYLISFYFILFLLLLPYVDTQPCLYKVLVLTI
jgi:hypothetical protein